MSSSTPPSSLRSLLASCGMVALVLLTLELSFRLSPYGRALSHESAYTAKARELSAADQQVDVAVLGDSRILHGVDPRPIEAAILLERGESLRVYNAGLPGAPPMGQLALVRRLLTRDQRPRLIVLSISPYMFSSRIAVAMARESLSAIWRVSDLPTARRAGASAEDLALIATADLLHLYRYRPRILDALSRFEGPRAPAHTGLQGFIQGGEVEPYAQDERARGRGMAYRYEMWRPAELNNEHMGYFVELLRMLRAARIKTIVINSPSASQIDLAYGPDSIYDEHIAWVTARVAEHGASWFDARRSPAVSDPDYTDGDHLGGNGAARFSAWLAHELIVPALGGRRADRPSTCKALFDVDAHGLAGFTLEGSAFQDAMRAQARRFQQPVQAYVGSLFVDSFGPAGDADQGEALSPPFDLRGASVRVRVAGGAAETQSVTLLVGDTEVASARGMGDEIMRDVVFDTRALRGQNARLRLRDHGAGAWEHISVDDIASCPE